MYINIVLLENYRNHKYLLKKISPVGCLITGKNGCGKTNFLEAVSFFSSGKSFRSVSDKDLISFGEEETKLQIKFDVNEQLHKLSCILTKEKKIISHDNEKVKTNSELYKWLKVVYLSPSDINLIYGSPNSRRIFFDQAISQFNYNYLLKIKKFYKILKQRNALLKIKHDKNLKKVWDDSFVDSAKEIVKLRAEYVKIFSEKFKIKYKKIIQEKEDINIEYKSFTTDLFQYEDLLRYNLIKMEEQELLLQRTLIGPHLDDFLFSINGVCSKQFASQGQARSIVIIARLVQALLISESNDRPIIMFDDVLADLDKERTDKVLDMIKNQFQIFIATPKLNLYRDFLPELRLE